MAVPRPGPDRRTPHSGATAGAVRLGDRFGAVSRSGAADLSRVGPPSRRMAAVERAFGRRPVGRCRRIRRMARKAGFVP
ncbi:hypothetical protein FMEAI12_1650016 [Parafrankia sp. Ea1.12]|nr:hypothetical protein FMEAI12_1650016 [Parafrankia sp. Ea1.12]